MTTARLEDSKRLHERESRIHAKNADSAAKRAARNREEGNILSAELDEAIFCASAIAADLHKQETLKNIIEIAAVSVN